MDYRELLKDENNAVRERLELSMERICSMEQEEMELPYGIYFKKTAGFIRLIGKTLERIGKEGRQEIPAASLEMLREENHRLYEDILPEN